MPIISLAVPFLKKNHIINTIKIIKEIFMSYTTEKQPQGKALDIKGFLREA